MRVFLVYESVCKAQFFMPGGLALGRPPLAHSLNEQAPSFVDSGPRVHRIWFPALCGACVCVVSSGSRVCFLGLCAICPVSLAS